MIRGLLLVICVASGCAHPSTALVGDKTVPRVGLGWSDGRYFSLVERGAWPATAGPSSGLHGWAGRVEGRVCNVDVRVDGQFAGRKLERWGLLQPTGVWATTSTSRSRWT